MTNEVKNLKEQIARLTEEQRGIYRTAKDEGRVITKEEEQRFDKLEADIAEKRSEVDRREKMFRMEAELAENRQREVDEKGEKAVDAKERYARTFQKYMSVGFNRLNHEEQDILRNRFSNIDTRGTDPQTTTDAAGGYTIPEGFSNELEVRMKYYGGMMEAARILRTDDGRRIPWPTVDDTAETGAILNEDNPSVATADMTFGQKLLDAYTYHSNIVKVSFPLLDDTAFNLQEFLTDAFARRIGSIANTHFTTGDGSDKPNGFETAVNAASGWVDAAAPASISRADVVDLIHGVDRAYRTPDTIFMLNDATLSAIKKIGFGSSDDRPLYQQSAIVGEADRIEGYRFIVNNDMDDIGTGKTPLAFGDFSKYVIRQVANMQMLRLNERYADSLQTGFIAYMRLDGELIQNNAIKLLKNA